MNTVNVVFDNISIFGCQDLIFTDNEPSFRLHLFKEFNNMLGLKMRFNSFSHFKSNSVSQQVNGSFKATIKVLIQDGYSFENPKKKSPMFI